jgi:hypothetical protein
MIPSNITAKDILRAIEMIDKKQQHPNGYPPDRKSKDYDLMYGDKYYPPKVVLSYANIPANGNELSHTLFHGGDESNSLLISLGFPIYDKRSESKEDFFNSLEIQFFRAYADKPYDQNNDIHINAARFIRSHIWSKSGKWADMLADKLSLRKEGSQRWNDWDRHGDTGQKFKHYTWYRLYDKDMEMPQVYFTVGVGGRDTNLVIKLDCQRQGVKALNASQIETFDKYLAAHDIEWLILEERLLGNLDWDKLIKLSEEYIKKAMPIYRSVVRILKGINKEMCARVCWNDNNWESPSGFQGKSQAKYPSGKQTYEGKHGFAHEEWLFDFTKIIDGYHYGRIEPFFTDSGKHIGNTYNLTLYAVNGDERQWYWIGRVENAEVITYEESRRISKIYLEKGWTDEQMAQLSKLKNINLQDYKNWNDTERFNIRFRVTDFKSYDYTPLKKGEKVPSEHYNLPERKEAPVFENFIGGLDYTERERGKAKGTITRTYRQTQSEIPNLHRQIQDELVELLRVEYPNDKFYPECRKNDLANRVDIVQVTKGGENIFYEIKTYPSVLHSIRVAVGQLLEYAFYPEQDLCKKSFIVTHLPANTVELRFLKYLSQKIGHSMEYIHYDCNSRKVITNPHI